ncbi:MAG TPA: UDP-N-acetylmuramoyl-tripeptide--D-alanyl-D-alanine ligase, partial [Saprospiraceae bacterium]|nr:UDP-N-acetylmuramoyl-tripeptide--D-alanyl-D-alanine ligase [Saprospiraceae bacterium]
MNLSIKDLCNVSHVREHRLAQFAAVQRFKQVSTDSRTIQKGDLFVALRGEKFDGHQFLNDVRKKGAIAAIVDEKWFEKNARTSLPCLVVKNSLDAYGELARIYRQKFLIPILIIAGSNGKTTTKDLLAHILGTSFKVLKTEANFNNQVGLPKMLFRLKKDYDLAVLEIGTNHPGEIAWLTNVAEPTHALVTNIGREHLEFFKDLDGVAGEELSALAITEELGGFAFLNYDDPYIRPMHQLFNEWSITFGTSSDADVQAKSMGRDAKNKHRIRIAVGKYKLSIRAQLLADYAANLSAGATAVGLHFGLKPNTIKKALESYTPHSKRMEIIHTANDITIINDAYNANPESFRSALITLAEMKTKGKKYVAAGDMFELGNRSVSEHRQLGKFMAEHPFAGFYFTGDTMKYAHN